MKKTISKLHKSQQLRDVKKKSMIFPPEGRSDVIEFLIHHITQLPKCAIYAAISIISIAAVNNTSALSYSDNVGVNFTFDQSLTVSLSNASGGSSADLVINNLAPGSASDSNVIDVNVLSNNLSGYTLASTVGNGNNYNDANLTHTNNSSNTFTSLPVSASVSSLDDFNDNTWGYTYSLDNGTTWINAHETIAGVKDLGYSGLPLYNTTGATLKTSTTPSAEDGDTIKFKIAAKASTAQPSGEYRNVINFTVTAEHSPVSFYDAFSGAGKTMYNGYYKMQDMTADICSNIYTSQLADNTDTMEAQLIDIRDNNIYWVAKLKDGHCWMTQNLDLNLNSNIALTSENTDLTDHSLTGAYQDGYTYDEATGVTTWTPKNSTTNPNATSWLNSATIPASLDGGTIYYFTSSSDDNDIIYLSLEECVAEHPGTDCTHYSRGNYYNWTAAIASNDSSSISSRYFSAQNSICAAGWRLPMGPIDNTDTGEFHKLFYASGIIDDSNPASYAENGANKIRSHPTFLVRGGWYRQGEDEFYAQTLNGHYLTSTDIGDRNIYILYFRTNLIQPDATGQRYQGRSIRCLASN